MEFKIHDVEWTDEKVSRFWTFQNQYAPFEDIWFTKQVGRGIINFLSGSIKINGTVLDYGTGKGHLIQHLLDLNSAQVYGFDFSPESVINVDGKYKSYKNYKGTTVIGSGQYYTTFQSDFFDVVFLIEAIEHLTDSYLQSTLKEIHRVLKKGGVVVVTTPNNEDLPLQHVLCPDCGGVFHRVQHMRSFDQKSLKSVMGSNGFETHSCGVTNFGHYNDKGSIMSVMKRLLAPFRSNYKQPHLWYVGKKK